MVDEDQKLFLVHVQLWLLQTIYRTSAVGPIVELVDCVWSRGQYLIGNNRGSHILRVAERGKQELA
jgi:hypothetical protein